MFKKFFEFCKVILVGLIGCEPKISFSAWLKGQTVKRWRFFSGPEMIAFVLGFVFFLGGLLRLGELILFCPVVTWFGFFLQVFWIISGGLMVAHAYESSSRVEQEIQERQRAERVQRLRDSQDKRFWQVKTAIGIE